MGPKTVITCALTGVLTNPAVYKVPVTPEEMADETWQAYNAGASTVHVHFRNQGPGLGHLPTWDLETVGAILAAIKARVHGDAAGRLTLAALPEAQGGLALADRAEDAGGLELSDDVP